MGRMGPSGASVDLDKFRLRRFVERPIDMGEMEVATSPCRGAPTTATNDDRPCPHLRSNAPLGKPPEKAIAGASCFALSPRHASRMCISPAQQLLDPGLHQADRRLPLPLGSVHKMAATRAWPSRFASRARRCSTRRSSMVAEAELIGAAIT